jgi:hypothetical protein
VAATVRGARSLLSAARRHPEVAEDVDVVLDTTTGRTGNVDEIRFERGVAVERVVHFDPTVVADALARTS